MSTPSELLQLLETLAISTEQGKIRWSETVDETSYRAVFPHGMVRLGKEPNSSLNDSVYTVTLMNQQAHIVQEFTIAVDRLEPGSSASDTHPSVIEFFAAEKLYEIVERSVQSRTRRANELIGKILEDVRSK